MNDVTFGDVIELRIKALREVVGRMHRLMQEPEGTPSIDLAPRLPAWMNAVNQCRREINDIMFRQTLKPDGELNGCPVWHGWAIMDAYLAGVKAGYRQAVCDDPYFRELDNDAGTKGSGMDQPTAAPMR